MAITTTIGASGLPQYKREGGTDGFYAVFNISSSKRPLVSIHYNSYEKSVRYPKMILEPDFLNPSAGLYKDIEADPIDDPSNIARNEFESFLLHLFGAGIFISSTEVCHDLDSDMVAGSVDSMYSGINILDLMVFTKAKSQTYKQVDGTIIKLNKLTYDDTRPDLTDVDDLDQSLMIDVIKHVGLKGFVPYLYAAEAINFDTFAELITFFYPDLTDRAVYWGTPTTGLQAFFAANAVPMLTDSEFTQLGLS